MGFSRPQDSKVLDRHCRQFKERTLIKVNEMHDPTVLFRQGTRLAEGRYQAEILFRNRMVDEPTNDRDRISRYADEAIRAAALFEEAWMIATMRDEDMRVDVVTEDEPIRIFEVEPNK